MEKIRFTLAAVLGGLLALFAIQNMAPVQLHFLFWTFESRRIVVIGISLVVGFVIGWAIHGFRKGSRGR